MSTFSLALFSKKESVGKRAIKEGLEIYKKEKAETASRTAAPLEKESAVETQPLYLAVRYGHFAVAKELVTHKADIQAVDGLHKSKPRLALSIGSL